MNGLIAYMFPHNTDREDKSYDKEDSNRSRNRFKNKNINPDKKRANVFQNNLLYYQRCKELESEVEKLKRINKYLIDQVLESINIIHNFRRINIPKSPNHFTLETGVQGVRSDDLHCKSYR